MISRDKEECQQVWIKKKIINKLEYKLLEEKQKTGKSIKKGAFIDQLLADHLKIQNPKN